MSNLLPKNDDACQLKRQQQFCKHNLPKQPASRNHETLIPIQCYMPGKACPSPATSCPSVLLHDAMPTPTWGHMAACHVTPKGTLLVKAVVAPTNTPASPPTPGETHRAGKFVGNPHASAHAGAQACTCALACRGGGARNAGVPVAPRPATSTFTSYVPVPTAWLKSPP